MLKYRELKIGSKVRCLNGDGWGGFVEGGIYEVKQLWDFGIELSGGYPSSSVAEEFYQDFELVSK